MNDEERCGTVGPGGLECTMPAGHGGKEHGFEIQLPPDLGKMMSQYMDHLDHQIAAYNQARKHLRYGLIALIAAIVLNLLSMFNAVFGWMS